MRRRFSKSGLFFMELVISIGFFAVAGAVCVQLFAAAHNTSRRSSDLSMAMVAAETAAETFKASLKAGEQVEEWPGAAADQVYYDSDWQPAANGQEAAYRTVVVYRREERLCSADIAVYGSGGERPIYQITAKKAVDR